MKSVRVQEVTFVNGAVELAGSLRVPVEADLPVAGVVLVGGPGRPTGTTAHTSCRSSSTLQRLDLPCSRMTSAVLASHLVIGAQRPWMIWRLMQARR